MSDSPQSQIPSFEELEKLPPHCRKDLLTRLEIVTEMDGVEHGQINLKLRELSIRHGFSIQTIQRWLSSYRKSGAQALINKRLMGARATDH